ncbi:DsbA family oxidoreductase [Vallicoccus soli]|uniref:DsbA family oxidoreductase n=1 Tax=Vallicoccus soli TaxID=2339232 RepID=A0A3A3Z227_9ACTN|nr:DsbA family oxidoreductase [Vallicoccus soli]RJK97504.1 DsbA family oxidoreductase [Vallicoccus soli]
MKVEVWSDVVCPWCYVGKRRFEAALARFEHRDEVEVVWRSFELDPGAVSDPAGHEPGPHDYADRLARKYGGTRERAGQMIATMVDQAAAEGLDLRFDRAVRAGTFDAHQVLHLAADRGLQDAVKERLLRGYFTEGEAVGDREVLVRLAAEAGLDADEVRGALERQDHAEAVRADEAEAAALGITGVPFFVVDRRYGVSGAQPADLLLQALRQAWAEGHRITVLDAVGAPGAGEACGPEGC